MFHTLPVGNMTWLQLEKNKIQSKDFIFALINLIERNIPQSNVTEPNKGNVLTVTVFGNEEKNLAAVCGEASVLLSVLPPVLPTPQHIFA